MAETDTEEVNYRAGANLAAVASTNVADGILLTGLPIAIASGAVKPSTIASAIALMWVPSFMIAIVGSAMFPRMGLFLALRWLQLLRVLLLIVLGPTPILRFGNSAGPWMVAALGGIVMAVSYTHLTLPTKA